MLCLFKHKLLIAAVVCFSQLLVSRSTQELCYNLVEFRARIDVRKRIQIKDAADIIRVGNRHADVRIVEIVRHMHIYISVFKGLNPLYIECNMGAAGDMLIAVLLELCPDKES